VVRPHGCAWGELLIDIAAPLAADTLRRLLMYRLRADVQIAPPAC
jgi:folate-binding Fe-S cluster repair protein YgfZ